MKLGRKRDDSLRWNTTTRVCKPSQMTIRLELDNAMDRALSALHRGTTRPYGKYGTHVLENGDPLKKVFDHKSTTMAS